MQRTKVFITCIFLLLIAAQTVTGFPVPKAAAQTFPSKRITIVVPYQPGGSVDLSSRMVAESFQKQFNVPVIVENRAEAGGVPAIQSVYRGNPDGHTLLATNLPAHVQPEVIYQFPYKLLELTYVGGFVRLDMLLAVKKDSPYQTLADVIEASKKRSLNGSITGMGSLGHLQLISLKKQAGLQVEAAPFKGVVPAVMALAGGHVDVSVLDELMAGLHKDKVRAVTAFSEKRLPKFQEVPTAKELGYDIGGAALIGYTAPPGVPEEIRRVLEDGLSKAIGGDPEVAAKVAKLGVTAQYLSGSEFHAAARRFHVIISESKELFKEKK